MVPQPVTPLTYTQRLKNRVTELELDIQRLREHYERLLAEQKASYAKRATKPKVVVHKQVASDAKEHAENVRRSVTQQQAALWRCQVEALREELHIRQARIDAGMSRRTQMYGLLGLLLLAEDGDMTDEEYDTAMETVLRGARTVVALERREQQNRRLHTVTRETGYVHAGVPTK